MKKINIHYLDFKRTYEYFIDHIDSDKILSKKIVEEINFLNGKFYTLLPDHANLNQLYHFKNGGILPPIKEKPNIAYKNAEIVPTVDVEFSEFIFKFLNENSKNIAIFENYNASPSSFKLDIEKVQVSLFNDEVYFVIKNSAPLSSIIKANNQTNLVWHSATLLASDIESIPINLYKDNFNIFCRNVVYVATTAYDGEGYIIWEKHGELR